MRHQIGEDKRRKNSTKLEETSSEKKDIEADILTDTEIDPAEFFDPEEFGYRRHREPLRP